ncbi:MAG: hypothetical protein LBL84_01705, partial [Candidatus Nomurabacteria bacterium]|nr:hypothetical protein [Candidatus Nomurabacteria bacterium]
MLGRLKFALAAVVLAICFALIGCGAESLQVPTPQEDVFVYDQDEVLSDDTEAAINSMLVDLEEKTT